jgi:protein-tyrosine phosphatase
MTLSAKQFFSKMAVLMLLGWRIEAISILGREVMLPRGLTGLGCDTVDYCQPEIAQVNSL